MSTNCSPSQRTPAYIDAVLQPRRTYSEKVLAVRLRRGRSTVVKATGWRWIGSNRDNWTEVQLVVDGVQRAQRSVEDAASPLFCTLLSVYVGDEAERLVDEVKAALRGAPAPL